MPIESCNYVRSHPSIDKLVIYNETRKVVIRFEPLTEWIHAEFFELGEPVTGVPVGRNTLQFILESDQVTMISLLNCYWKK